MLFPLSLPVPVSAVRDGWDWLIVWCTVGAAVLALVAIVFAVIAIRRGDRNAREAQEATVRERRNVFELGVLARLIEICGLSPPGAAQVLQGLLAVLPEKDLPGIRAEAAEGRVPSNQALTPFMPEYLEAVRRRLGPARSAVRRGPGGCTSGVAARNHDGANRHPHGSRGPSRRSSASTWYPWR
jgi:hypothetical protein